MKEWLKVDVRDLKLRYEAQTDILYIDFGVEDEEAEETVLIGDTIVLRVKGDRLLGLTIMEFTKTVGSDFSIREF